MRALGLCGGPFCPYKRPPTTHFIKLFHSKNYVIENIDIRKLVKIIDGPIDPDGYNRSSIVILCKELKGSGCREGLKDLIVELRHYFPDALVLGVKEIGVYYIRVSDEMNQLRSELSDLSYI